MQNGGTRIAPTLMNSEFNGGLEKDKNLSCEVVLDHFVLVVAPKMPQSDSPIVQDGVKHGSGG